MKTKSFLEAFLLLFALLFPRVVNASENYCLYASDVDIEKGDAEVMLPIFLDNPSSITGVQFDLVLPEGAEVAYTINRNGDKSYTSTITKGGDRFPADDDHTISCRLQPNGDMRIILSSLNNKPLTDYDSNGNDIRRTAPILYVMLTLPQDFAGCDNTVGIEHVVLSSYVNNITSKFEAENSYSSIMINKHLVSFLIDGAVVKSDSLEFGSPIVPPEIQDKEGYTFSGWSDFPETMPAHDVEVNGTFSINSYKLTYKVDGTVYKEYTVEYNSAITPETEPTKEGYTFSGWSEIPSTMPAHDVEVNGTFEINSYTIFYVVDGEEYATESYEYGASIILIADPTKDGYIFSGWSGYPEDLIMPAQDITITGSFELDGIKDINILCNVESIYTLDGKKVDNPHAGLLIVRFTDGTIQKLYIK